MVYQAERPNPKQTPCTEMKQSFISERRSHEAIWIFRGRPQGRMRKRNERSVLRRRWPVGQEVKTGASHAPNVGSIPARVTKVGVNDDEGPPVPIPNTEVKLVGGENTCLATDREDSTMPTLMFLNSSVGRARGC